VARQFRNALSAPNPADGPLRAVKSHPWNLDVSPRSMRGRQVTQLDLLPELRLTDDGLIRDGHANIAYEQIDAITFKLVPLIQNRLSRAFYGVDTTVVLGSSGVVPKLALHLADGETIALFTGWEPGAMSQSSLLTGRGQAPQSRPRLEAICGAAEFLSERTFDRRFARYRAQFEADGRFSFGGYEFDRNGDIFKNGRRLLNLHERGIYIGLGEFHIHVERKDTPIEKLKSVLGQGGHTIDISTDRDCFLSMVRLAHGMFWTDESYRDDVRHP
jgi:hypothetical protein